MRSPQHAFWALCSLFVAASFPAAGQSVISTHSGLVYFFEGSVYLGDQPLQQSFGRFPDIGDGGQLRTEHGRAEILLNPGTFLRIGDNSAIRMLSTTLADTRVELLSGSAIVEVREATDAPARVILKSWQVRLPEQGIYRLDADPAQVTMHKGEAEVSAQGGKAPVTLKEGERLPLQAVLVAESAEPDKTDEFDRWAMGRSQEIYADNNTASQIFDDPTLADTAGLGLSSAVGIGGFSRFPMSMPSLGLGSPYGVSFWSPFQSSLIAIYVPIYQYPPLYLGYGYRGFMGGGLRYSQLPGVGIMAPTRIGGRYPAGAGYPVGARYPAGSVAPMPPPMRTQPGRIAPPHAGGARSIGRR